MSHVVVKAKREKGKIIPIPGYFDEEGNPLSEEVVQEAFARFLLEQMNNDKDFPSKMSLKPATELPVQSEWYWEGNVQSTLSDYLIKNGWLIEHAANTANHEHGPDIKAAQNGRKVWVEVKGYPSTTYAQGEKKGQPKPTKPSLQAKHWFEEALHSCIQRRSKNPKVELIIAFPDFKRYCDLIKEAEWAFQKLNINVFLVKEDNSVEKLIGDL